LKKHISEASWGKIRCYLQYPLRNAFKDGKDKGDVEKKLFGLKLKI
jgi:hypothetical protein